MAVKPSGRLQLKEVHILWITAGLGCDGDSVSITAATQPSIEDVILGAIPGLPKVHLHNPVLAYEKGDDFMKPFTKRKKATRSFVLVVEGSIPNEKINSEGYWAGFGTDKKQGSQSHTTVDRLARTKSAGVVAIGTCATYGGIHAMAGNPTGAWVWPIIWDGIGNQRRESQSSMCPDVRFNQITSWRHCYISCIRPRTIPDDSSG